MNRWINATSIKWEIWEFEDVESIFQEYARAIDADYDSKHPLSFLPETAAKDALKHIGSDCKELVEIMGESYKTVLGWFRPRRNPSRSLVEERIFPALCGTFYIHMDKSIEQSREAYACFMEGKPLTGKTRIDVQKRVASLICTGKTLMREDVESEHARCLEKFQRSVIHFLAEHLAEDELATFSQQALSCISMHTARRDQQENPDELTTLIKDLDWDLWETASSDAESGNERDPGSPFSSAFQIERHCIDLDIPTIQKLLSRLRPYELDSIKEMTEVRISGLGHPLDYESIVV